MIAYSQLNQGLIKNEVVIFQLTQASTTVKIKAIKSGLDAADGTVRVESSDDKDAGPWAPVAALDIDLTQDDNDQEATANGQNATYYRVTVDPGSNSTGKLCIDLTGEA